MTLLVLAAGMGSRYGGLKQIDKVDDFGHIIIDYSIYDAMKAGFRDITFIIKKEIEKDETAIGAVYTTAPAAEADKQAIKSNVVKVKDVNVLVK